MLYIAKDTIINAKSLLLSAKRIPISREIKAARLGLKLYDTYENRNVFHKTANDSNSPFINTESNPVFRGE